MLCIKFYCPMILFVHWFRCFKLNSWDKRQILLYGFTRSSFSKDLWKGWFCIIKEYFIIRAKVTDCHNVFYISIKTAATVFGGIPLLVKRDLHILLPLLYWNLSIDLKVLFLQVNADQPWRCYPWYQYKSIQDKSNQYKCS